MAPRIKVPADFGREHINSEVHGNLILKLKDGEQIRANSMIMSLNSPVINNLISDLCQSTLEMDDFSSEVVNCFVDCMYTGEIERLKKDVFEDVNKMAHAFKVSWLSKKCLKFYQTVILNFEKNAFNDILFACEIASRAHSNLKQTKFVKYFVKSAASWKIGKSIFIQRYMADFAQLSKRQLDMSLRIANDEPNLIANCLVSHLSITLRSEEFDENSLYLLNNIDLVKFARKFPANYQEFSHFIAEISEVSSSEGICILPVLDKLAQVNKNKADKVASDSSDSQKTEFLESSDSEDLSDNESNRGASRSDATISKATDWTKIPSCDPVSTIVKVENQNLDKTVLEMVTTNNDPGKIIELSYHFMVDKKKVRSRLFLRCNDGRILRWSYVLEGCTKFTFGDRLLAGIPDSKVKMWKITKTPFIIEIMCNDATVLTFNFDRDSIKTCQESCKKWSGKPKAIGIASQFSEHTFVKVT